MRRWEELRPEFDQRGVQIVTVSTDLPEEIRERRNVHGLQAHMLSDRDLA
ncbi:MAG: redoxin domain-containing protein, partial [Bacteroidota bacterium]